MNMESRRIRFVMFTVILLLALNLTNAILEWGWPAITVSVGLVFALQCGFTIYYRDPQLGRWILIGLVAGWVELVADWWLVRTGTLVYPSGEPMIWASPAYMPFAWTVVLVQIGAIGCWFKQRHGMLSATLITALLSGINIPIYEHLAKRSQVWFYQDTPMIFNAPYYVILAEFILALPLVWIGVVAQQKKPGWSLGLGAVEGAWMFPTVVFAFWLIGPCGGAVIQWTCN